MQKPLSDLEILFHIKITDHALWEEALTHKSWAYFHPGEHAENNERLEFLGDAVLELVISTVLYKKYPKRKEGDLTLIRAMLVNKDKLAEVAEELKLSSYARVGYNIAERGMNTVLANMMEAVIGAMFLDQGMEKVSAFIQQYFLEDLERKVGNQDFKDAKSRLQEILQADFGILPEYRVLHEKGPAHKKIFRIGLFVNDQLLIETEGANKQDAELKAAEAALKDSLWQNYTSKN